MHGSACHMGMSDLLLNPAQMPIPSGCSWVLGGEFHFWMTIPQKEGAFSHGWPNESFTSAGCFWSGTEKNRPGAKWIQEWMWNDEWHSRTPSSFLAPFSDSALPWPSKTKPVNLAHMIR